MLEFLTLVFILIFSSILSLFIYFNNPKSDTNRIYALSGISIIFWSSIMYLSIQPFSAGTTLFFIRLSMLAGSLMATSFLLLALVFPDTKQKINKTYYFLILGLSLLTMIVAMSPFMFTRLEYVNGKPSPVPGPGILTFVLTGVGYNFLTVIILIKKFFKSTGRAKQQILLILFGIAMMFGFMIVANFIIVVLFKTSSFIALGPLFTTIFLASTGYAILRHRLLDVRFLVARTASYSIMVLMVVATYILLLFGVANLIPGVELNINLSIVLSIVGVILFFSAGPLQRLIQNLTDKVFFKAGYDTDELLAEMTKIMASNIELHSLSDRILNLLIKNVKLTKGAFVIVKDHQITNIQSKGYRDEEIKNNTWIDELLHRDEINYVYEELEDEKLKESFREFDTAIALPMKVKDQEIGVFLIGPKASGELYSAQDLELFEILAPQLAIAMQNAESYAEIQKFSVTLERKVEERTKELRQAQESELSKAKEIIRLKDEFVFIATHDLRTPATAIKGFVSLIKETAGELPESLAEDIDAIDQASERLMQLVDDLLEVARSESGTVKIEVKETDAKQIIDSVLQEIKPAAEQRKINIETDISPNSNVMADPEKLQEIIENLLSNAIKYNKDNGSLKITTTLENDNLIFVVSDSGLGIPKELQDKVFSKFFRAHQDGTEDVPGTGLGLFVVRMLVEKMKGNIEFESEEGKGTTFKFSLPIAK